MRRLTVTLLLISTASPAFAKGVAMARIDAVPAGTITFIEFGLPNMQSDVLAIPSTTEIVESEECKRLSAGERVVLASRISESGTLYTFRNDKNGISKEFCALDRHVTNIRLYQGNSGACYKFVDGLSGDEISVTAKFLENRMRTPMADFFDGMFLFEYMQSRVGRARVHNANVLSAYRKNLIDATSALNKSAKFTPVLIEHAEPETVDYFMINLLSSPVMFPAR
jgi:hypothetical protein